MSGPKGGDYTVVETAEQIEARLLRDAKARYARADSEWEGVAARVEALRGLTGDAPACVRPASVADGSDSAAWAQEAEALEQSTAGVAAAVSAAREQAARKSHEAQVARIMARMAEAPQAESKSARRPQKRQMGAPTVEEPAIVVDWVRVQERVERRMAELAGLDHDSARVEPLLGDIASARTQSRIDLLIGELDFLIAEARKAATRRAMIDAARGELSALLSKLEGLSGDEPVRLRTEIGALIRAGADDVPPPLSAAVDAAIAHAKAAEDRRHVVDVMRMALDELGYAVGPEFSTDLSGAQGVAFARDGSSNYGIKVRLEPGSSRFTAQAVKSDAALTSADEDVAAERSFCEDFEDLVRIAGREGVGMGIDIRTKAGAVAVQQVADAKLGRAAARPSGARHVKEREQPR